MKKIILIILLILVVGGASYYFVFEYQKDKVINESDKLVLIDEYKNFDTLDNYNDELFILKEKNNPIYGIIDDDYNVIEKFDNKEKGFLIKNTTNSNSDYYYVKNENYYIIKQKGIELFQFDMNTFKVIDKEQQINNFELGFIHEPDGDNIVIETLVTTNKKEYYGLFLYNYKTAKIVNYYIGNSNFGRVFLKDESYYYLVFDKDDNIAIIESKTFKLLNDKIYEEIGYDLGLMSDNRSTYIDSDKYIVAGNTIIDFKGNNILKNNYGEITDISPNDKYFVVLSDGYSLYSIEEKILLNNYDSIDVTKNYVVTTKNNKLVIYNKDLKKLKTIDFSISNLDFYINDLGKALEISYYDSSNNSKSYIYYNNKLIEHSYVSTINDLEDNIILTETDKGFDIYNNSLDKLKSIETKDKYFEAIKLSNKDNKACVMTKINRDSEEENYMVINFTSGVVTKSNEYDCKRLSETSNREIDIEKILLEDSKGKRITSKIYDIEPISENCYKVTFNGYSNIFKYVTK